MSAAVPLASAAAGDARALGEADASIDAVLMFGPLYHLQDSQERLVALREARRVLRPGGVLLASALSRLYPVFEAIAADDTDPAEAEAEFLSAGRYRNPSGDPRLFTTSYFHRPDELADEVRQAGFVLRRLAAGSGALKLLVPDLGERLDDPAQAARLLDLMRLVEAEPSLLGMSQNFVAIATKPGRP